MSGYKSIYTSKTFWGSIIAAAASVGSIFGISIDAAALTNELFTLFGAALAIYGRIVASELIQ